MPGVIKCSSSAIFFMVVSQCLRPCEERQRRSNPGAAHRTPGLLRLRLAMTAENSFTGQPTETTATVHPRYLHHAVEGTTMRTGFFCFSLLCFARLVPSALAS